tara:strand:- start:12717 stop:13181 length:465 start_codon:yes stop_codon:yes gene_type:complete
MAINETTTVYGNSIDIPASKSATGKVDKVYGFHFPLGAEQGGGFFAKSSGKELVVNNLKQLFGTDKGERLMLSDFGVSLKRFLFEPLDEITIADIKREVVNAIHKWEPRVDIIDLHVRHVEEYGLEGLQAISIGLTAQVGTDPDSRVHVPIRIG